MMSFSFNLKKYWIIFRKSRVVLTVSQPYWHRTGQLWFLSTAAGILAGINTFAMSLLSEGSGMNHHAVESCTVVSQIKITVQFKEKWILFTLDPKMKRTMGTVFSSRPCDGTGLHQYSWQRWPILNNINAENHKWTLTHLFFVRNIHVIFNERKKAHSVQIT